MIKLDLVSIAPTDRLASAQAAIDTCAIDQGLATLRAHDGAWLTLREPLIAAQAAKCAYCEDWLRERMIEVDHIRPKARYWWLAFQARNLLATCRSCNNAKSNKWRLRTGANSLEPRALPWDTSEAAMLVDPTCDDPDRHLTYVEIDGVWRIAALSDEGSWTIDALGLDRDSVRKDMNLLIRWAVRPAITRLLDARDRRNRSAFETAKLELAEYADRSGLFSQLVRTEIARSVS